MNLKEKEKLKQKVESLEMLISCIDQDWLFEHSSLNLKRDSVIMLASLLITTSGDKNLALNLLLRMLNSLIHQIKQEIL